ncbi:MAG: DUF2946 domain-containing protein [Alphaproteobacteria bacterium]|nr:DUF2946 domain-containing protein [Alphaproteobacteria bacterium]
MIRSRPLSRPRPCARPVLRRVAARAGILALLLQVLLPVHGFAAPDGARVPVCTAGGIVWKALADGPETPPPATDRTAADCPFCLVHAAAFAPDAPAAVPLPVARPVHALRPALAAIHVIPQFRAHGSRGPPAAV